MKTKQRTNLKILVRLGKSPSEAICMLKQVYQEQTLSRSTVFLWHKRFKEGREDSENDPRGGRPSTSRNETFFDVRGMEHYEFLPQGQTVNNHVYKEILQRLLYSVREKRRYLWGSNTWLLHHDNAPAHTALSIWKFLADKNLSVLEQPPYSPDLAQSNFFLFSKVKNIIKGTHFLSTDSIKNAVTKEFWGVPQESLQKCIDACKRRIELYITCIVVQNVH